MNGFTINISWEYFLVIMGGLISIAWYSSGRFSKLETSMDWVKETLKELKITSDNETADAFGSHSPISLKQKTSIIVVKQEKEFKASYYPDSPSPMEAEKFYTTKTPLEALSSLASYLLREGKFNNNTK